MPGYFIFLDKPSLKDQRSDWQRVKDSLAEKGVMAGEVENPVLLLREVPKLIRGAGYSLTAIKYDNKILGLEPQKKPDTMLGMAFDIGTTTIVGYLLDLYSGKELAVVSTLNPQTKFGADVISRITFANQDKEGLAKLHRAVISAINQLINEAADKISNEKSNIYAISIAANTTMHHLFLGISPGSIAVSPYVAAINDPLVLNPADLNIEINEAGRVFVLPNIAGFVGADTTAVLLATSKPK